MADNRDPLEKERDVLVTCVEEAYEALRLLPGLDANGPAVVWLADQLLQIRRRYQSAGSAGHPSRGEHAEGCPGQPIGLVGRHAGPVLAAVGLLEGSGVEVSPPAPALSECQLRPAGGDPTDDGLAIGIDPLEGTRPVVVAGPAEDQQSIDRLVEVSR